MIFLRKCLLKKLNDINQAGDEAEAEHTNENEFDECAGSGGL
jgi:hypothetical protein